MFDDFDTQESCEELFMDDMDFGPSDDELDCPHEWDMVEADAPDYDGDYFGEFDYPEFDE